MDNTCYEDDIFDDFDQDPNAVRSLPDGIISISMPDGQPSSRWSFPIFPSLLPQYTEKVEVPSDMTLLERMLSAFTMYGELKNATLDSQYERVFGRLQMEWTYIGGLVRLMATYYSIDLLIHTLAARGYGGVSSLYPHPS